MQAVRVRAWACACAWLAVAWASGVSALRCPREPSPDVTGALRSPGDRGYRVVVSGQPDYYVPDAVYTLSLLGARAHGRLQSFSRFVLAVEPADARAEASPQRTGTFQLFPDALARFHDECVNAVREADALPKTEVQAMWTAPPAGSGCVLFRAMVLENVDNWWADEGALTLRLCELPDAAAAAAANASASECCACAEAKYQLVFEGLWSNATHPKDFPFSLWLTHFSDVIGASHARGFSFWGEGQVASDGLRMVAEWGSVRALEQELRAQAKHLRTLIKAGGLWYPNVNSNTSTTFRVDQQKHLLSIVSMLGPTPDWIVGVSGLNLCERDCTFAEEKTVDLFPYDAGTDNGITYMSPNSPTVPRERVRRITELYPEDPRAPFYDPSGRRMLPLARLYLRRTALADRPCGAAPTDGADLPVEETDNAEDSARPECAVSAYSAWSACSVTCGKGLRMRQRSYLMAAKAAMLGCGRQLVAKEMCVATAPSCPGDPDDADLLSLLGGGGAEEAEACATSEWGAWSECSASCGAGEEVRARRFLGRMGFKLCPRVETRQRRPCQRPACPADLQPPAGADAQAEAEAACPATAWSEWSPCSASCGRGVKVRSRLLLVAPALQERCGARRELLQTRHCVERHDCLVDPQAAQRVCSLEPEAGPCRGLFPRWHFEPRKGMCVPFDYGGCRGNRNNFLTQDECTEACGAVVHGGVEAAGAGQEQAEEQSRDEAVHCQVSSWGPWGDCSASCGRAVQQRSRVVLVEPKNGGKPCPKRLVRKKKCNLPDCDDIY